jgi:O-antigen ligase
VKIFKLFTYIGIYISINGIFEHYRIDALVWPDYIMNDQIGIQWERLRGPFISSVVCGTILVLSFINMSILYTTINSNKKLIMLFLMGITIICVYFTYTRSIWVAQFVIMVFFILTRNDFKKPISILLIVLFIGAMIGVGNKLSLFKGATLFSQRQNTIEYRMVNYQTAYKMFKDKPMFGIGYGNFLNNWDLYLDNNNYASVEDLKDGNHNYILGLLAETGIITVLLYLLIYIIIIRDCLKCYRKLNNTYNLEKNIIIIIFAIILEAFLIGMTSDLRFHPLFLSIMFMFFGFSKSIHRNINDTIK